MELKLIDDKGQPGAAVEVSDALFGREYNEPLIHQIVTAYRANGRQGTRAQKGRAQIAKSTKKPWRQKGTGRARSGMASSPLWRGGGKIFPSMPDENFTHKVNRKMYRAGLCSILSQLAREGRLSVVEEIVLEAPKTKLLATKLKGMGVVDQVMIITESLDDNLYLASRNLANLLLVDVQQADPVSLVHYPRILVTRSAVKKLEEVLA